MKSEMEGSSLWGKGHRKQKKTQSTWKMLKDGSKIKRAEEVFTGITILAGMDSHAVRPF